jgi:hypothetical protein
MYRLIQLLSEAGSLFKAIEQVSDRSDVEIEPRTSPDTAAQNGGSEQSGMMIVTKSRAMRIEVRLPSNMWPEIVVEAAAYILIRTPLKQLDWKPQYEAICKHVPPMLTPYPTLEPSLLPGANGKTAPDRNQVAADVGP